MGALGNRAGRRRSVMASSIDPFTGLPTPTFVRTWLTLWLSACLLLASPVRGDCCLGMGAGAGSDNAEAATASAQPPCHSHAATIDAGSGEPRPAPSAPAASDCDHCHCLCRIAAVPLLLLAPGAAPLPTWPPVVASPGVDDPARIPPSPPPIA